MTSITYYAKIEKEGEGYVGTIPDVAGLEKVKASGETSKEGCRSVLWSRLNLALNVRRARGEPIPEPNEYAKGLEPIIITVPFKTDFVNYDRDGPSKAGDIVSFSIENPEDIKSTYCIGYRFAGGNKKDPGNYEYDHTNYCRKDTNLYSLVDKEAIIEILTNEGTNLEALLDQYIGTFKPKIFRVLHGLFINRSSSKARKN